MSRLIAELDTALEQRAGAASLALMPIDNARRDRLFALISRWRGLASTLRWPPPSTMHPGAFFAASEAFCDGR